MEMYADRKEALEAAGLRESFYAALVMFSRSARLAFSSAVKVTDPENLCAGHVVSYELVPEHPSPPPGGFGGLRDTG
jgi:hypothetical protein